jgi:formyl-CoA transferase
MKDELPLKGMKILDAATMMAAPWASTFLSDFGAEVIKVEHPKTGDHAREYGMHKDGVSLFWKSLNRNKKSITLDLSKPEGQELFLDLVKEVDVVVENFRPKTMKKWNLGWDELSKANPSLILLSTTGFGQEGPYSSRRGFGTVAEGMSGFTSVNGDANGPPTLPGIALADGISSIFGALSIMIAYHERNNNETKEGQWIDISLYEPLMRLLEPQILAYDQLGVISKRIGNSSMQTAPRNAYQTKEGTWVALSASTQSIASNVFKAIGRPELIKEEKFSTNENRMKNVKELDSIIAEWIGKRSLEDVTRIFNDAGAVVGPMYGIDQLFEDVHYKYRESFIKLLDKDFGEVTVPNVVAKFSRTPGRVQKPGPDHGEHNHEIYGTVLNLSTEEIENLKTKSVI